MLAGCQSNQATPESTPAPATTSTSTGQQTTSSTEASNQTMNSGTNATKEIKVSAQKAIELFQKEYPNAAITSLELDSSWGSFFYKIDGVDDQNEYEMKINAANEEIQKQNPERLDQDEQNGQKKQEDALDTSKLLSIEEAAKIAEKQAGGGTATDWDLSKELGTTYWEVKVKNGNKSTQVKLNSQTGEVLATENDD
ncbi:PepSY domain-containing protein [Enterococcus hirae]|uniref:PepSY domain-containing protein n=1 Tax=Enterococcus hirae TaxID=1354 RepID=UPI000FFB0BBB|nr:PepSY domain-containing protein [Enterococcus hirae]EMF0475401.1 PepSY domain-containing protein [Enterococcus hirae]RXA86067.1 lysis protein [Enterococcus hirae]